MTLRYKFCLNKIEWLVSELRSARAVIPGQSTMGPPSARDAAIDREGSSPPKNKMNPPAGVPMFANTRGMSRVKNEGTYFRAGQAECAYLRLMRVGWTHLRVGHLGQVDSSWSWM